MKSKASSINNLNWTSTLTDLNGSRETKTIQSLEEAGIKTIHDLAWIFPLRLQKLPELQNYSFVEDGKLFYGRGEVISFKAAPAFGRKGKGRVQLFNLSVVVKDPQENSYLTLKWFNTYPSIQSKLKNIDLLTFLGEARVSNGVKQIINPKIDPQVEGEVLIQYPTINKVTGANIEKLIKKIPMSLWNGPMNTISDQYSSELMDLNTCFKAMHGIQTDSTDLELIKKRLIFEEFFWGQIKIESRKKFLKTKKSAVIKKPQSDFISSLLSTFPYKLTDDQLKALDEILEDFASGTQMMRIVQGDVGCGKTTVAILATLLCAKKSTNQIAIMCPTEALASQHLKTFSYFFNRMNIPYAYLVGSTKIRERNDIYKQVESGEIQVLIGTHALFQDKVIFKNLVFCIIDEQHKFGVEQRQRLVSKGDNPHCLLMTATPIPRTLQLAQFGDLDITTIRTMPGGRKGIKTRIIQPDNYQKYLSFIKTRVCIGEQVYVVVPAIEESATLDLKNVSEHFEFYRKLFPDLKIDSLHGQMAADDKSSVLEKFTNGKVDILITTSVIEVGINIPNATVMSIYNPDRFGLSSLHQLRGRVGRGEKPGFCFLVSDTKLSKESLHRLSVIERSTDGFVISEADLKIRGEGDLFGSNQSGNISTYKIASLVENRDVFHEVVKLFNSPQVKNNQEIQQLINNYQNSDSVI